MSADKLMMLFCDMRNEILKEGILPAIAEISPGFIINGDVGLVGASPPPKGKKITGQIMSHQFGGVVWETTRPDGTIEYFPARFPQGISQTLYPDRTKVKHLGTMYERPTMLKLCELFVAYFKRLIIEAKLTFRAKMGVVEN